MLCSLAASIDRARFRPIVGLFRPGWLKEQCEQQGIETHVFPTGGMLHGAWISGCTRLVREERVALIHAHEFDANVHGTLVAAITGVPIVATVHGKHYYWTKFRRRAAYRFVSRFATMVAVSQNLKDFIGQKVGIDQARIRVIYNGVKPLPEYFAGNILGCRVELGIPEGDQIVGVVGSLYPVKGHRFLVEAIPHVISAEMQMAYSEDELDAHMEVLANSDVVPKMLNDDTIDVDKIIYRGDLKKKDLEGFAAEFDKVD